MLLRGFAAGTITTITSVLLYNQVSQRRRDDEKAKQSGTKENRHILKYGTPEHGLQVLHYRNHSVGYDWSKKTPVWVAERITKENIRGTASRKNVNFKPDPNVPMEFTAINKDYWHSGYSRGHMAPAGNNKHSQDAMVDSFYLTNVVPQNIDNNAGFWNRLEMYCRDLTHRWATVQIFSGPLMLQTRRTEDGKHGLVTYMLIGENDVAVPTHLYKLIIVENEKSEPVGIGAFIVPNEPIGFDRRLDEYQVTVEELQKKAGIHFVPGLDTSKVENLCYVDSCDLIERVEFELYFIGRKLASARTLDALNKVWNELEEKELKPTEYLKNLYKERINELKSKDNMQQERRAQGA